jgi:hypothetical protein
MRKDRPKGKSHVSRSDRHGDAPAAVVQSPRASTWDALVRFAIPTVIAAAFAGMLWWSWMKWADLLVDFGRELYTPWRITQGQVLYRDIAAFGPPAGASTRGCSRSWRELARSRWATWPSRSRADADVPLAGWPPPWRARRSLAVRHSLNHPNISNYNYITPYARGHARLVLSITAMFLIRFSAREWVAVGMGLLGLVFSLPERCRGRTGGGRRARALVAATARLVTVAALVLSAAAGAGGVDV